MLQGSRSVPVPGHIEMMYGLSNNLHPIAVNLLLPFHAITGSDTCFLFGHPKRTALNNFHAEGRLLNTPGGWELIQEKVANLNA